MESQKDFFLGDENVKNAILATILISPEHSRYVINIFFFENLANKIASLEFCL